MFEVAQRQHRAQNSHMISLTKPDQAMHRQVHLENTPLVGGPDLGNQVAQRLLRSGATQAKLTINEPGDRYEQEADRVAERVMRMPDPGATSEATISRQDQGIQRMCSECEEELHREPIEEGKTFGQTPRIQRMCSECEEELHRRPVEGERKVLRTGGFPDQTARPTPDVETSIKALRGGGQPLPRSVRAFFEPRFGHDFSQVRVHTHARAAESARAVNALAYTVGRDVVFGAGQYAPGTAEGKRLLAHELTHTFQQTGADGATGDGSTRLQRTIGDGHDLTATRFAGDVVLEAVYDDERLLRVGDRGPAVVKLQQALVDAGFSLPRFGVDGIFGAETKAAVEGFQRASGLAGGFPRGVDGIVGPTTMGWLDQRFSAGPTPPGTAPRATPGCPNIKTVNVDLVSLDGSRPGALQELDRANSIFNQCCVKFALTGGGSLGDERTRELLGDDKALHINPRCGGDPTMEEIGMINGAAAEFNLSGRIRVFYVGSITPRSTPMGDTDAFSVPPFCATGAKAALRNMVVITNTASDRALAHEFGHVLRNDSVHWDDDPTALMSPAGPTPGERLTPDDCGVIFDNV